MAKGDKHLLKAWALCEKGDLEEGKTQIIDMQANVAFMRQDYKKAELLFKNVAQRLIYHQNHLQTDNSIVEISLKLAQIYKETGRFPEALAGFQYCVETQQKKVNR